MSYITPDDIRNFTAIDLSEVDDATLALFAEQATILVENYCNKSWTERDVEQEKREGVVNMQGQCFLEFGVKPVISVYEIQMTPLGGGQTVLVPSGTYDLFEKAGYLYTHHSFGMAHNRYFYKILFSGGELPPDDVKYATNLIAQGLLYPHITASGGGSTGTIEESSVVQSFKSLNYEVSYAVAKPSEKTASRGKFFTATVASILDKYKVINQSW